MFQNISKNTQDVFEEGVEYTQDKKGFDGREFLKRGVKLCFVKTKEIKYKQFDGKFQPNLSIIDILMFNSKNDVKKMLDEFELING